MRGRGVGEAGTMSGLWPRQLLPGSRSTPPDATTPARGTKYASAPGCQRAALLQLDGGSGEGADARGVFLRMWRAGSIATLLCGMERGAADDGSNYTDVQLLCMGGGYLFSGRGRKRLLRGNRARPIRLPQGLPPAPDDFACRGGLGGGRGEADEVYEVREAKRERGRSWFHSGHPRTPAQR